MPIESKDPFTGEILHQFEEHSDEDIRLIVQDAHEAQQKWAELDVSHRCEIIQKLSVILSSDEDEIALTMTKEMGKPISQSRAEAQKCAWLCRHYASQFEEIMQPRVVKTEASKSFVTYEPLGVVLGIMPWNYPYWQVFRFIIPALLSGNSVVLKHASNVYLSAYKMQELFHQAGIPEGLFGIVNIKGSKASKLVDNEHVRIVTLTGSEAAGRSVAKAAGAAIKPVILELGGSNAMIVCEDADIDSAVQDAVIGRFQNNGQSCIAVKRILLHENIAEEFSQKFIASVKELWVGDPTDESCYIGPLAKPEFVVEVHDQVERSVAAGAVLEVGGRAKGNLYSPTILSNVKPGIPCFEEEVFGPVASVSNFADFDEAIHLANATKYGLGVSIYCENPKDYQKHIPAFKDGAVFFNSFVKSDPRLPFGGTHNSGFGRELGEEGALAFVNRKTVYLA